MITIVTARIAKTRFTSALQQPYTCLQTHFWGISCGSLKTILRFARSQGCRNVVRRIFNMFIFLAIFERCSKVARQPYGSLEVNARLTYEFAWSEVSHEGRKVVARRTCCCLAFDARLPQECYEAYDNCILSHSSCATVAQQLHDCRTAAARLSWGNVRLPFPVKGILYRGYYTSGYFI